MTTPFDKFPPYDIIEEDDVVEYNNKKWIYVLASSQGQGTSGGSAAGLGWYKLFDGRVEDTTLSSTNFAPTKPIRERANGIAADGTRTIDHFIDLQSIDPLGTSNP